MPEEPVKIELPVGVSEAQAREALKAQPVIFTEVDTGYLKQVRVQRNFYKGKELYGLQNFYKEDETQEDWQFGKAVNFPPECLDDIIEGLQKMKAYIEGS